MQTPEKPTTWTCLTEAQRAQVIAILVRMLLRQLTQAQEVER